MKLKKKILPLVLLCTLVIGNAAATTHASAASLSQSQKEQCYDKGYPRGYRSNLDNFYEAFQDLGGDSLPMGGSTFSEFLNFIDVVEDVSSSESDPYSALTRAMFLEVSNFGSKRIESIDGVADSLTNRLLVRDGYDYFSAASRALDGLNSSKPVTYWHDIMKQPIARACDNGMMGIESLVHSYIRTYSLMYNEEYLWQYSSDDNPAEEYKHYNRFSNVPEGYIFFNETPGAGRIKCGNFYFRKTY